MTTASVPTPFPPRAAACKYFYATARRGFQRRKRLFFPELRSAIGPMARPRKERPPTASEQLEALLGVPWPFPGRPPKHDLSTWTVTDDWPEHIPVTEAEVEVFEAWFGDLFDELFGPCL